MQTSRFFQWACALVALHVAAFSARAVEAAWISDGKAEPTDEAAFYGDDPAPLFRGTFVAPASGKVTLRIACLGVYDLWANGKRLSATSLMPLWTPFDKTILEDTYSFEAAVGTNVLGVALGNGWFNPLPMKMWGVYNLRKALAHGRPTFCVTLPYAISWRMAEGPVVRNNLYLGVVYDARKEVENWSARDFNDAAWREAKVVAKGAKGAMVPRNAPPLVPSERRVGKARWLNEKCRVQVIDFGVNGSGVSTFRLGKGVAGERISFRFGELLFPDGSVNTLTQTMGQIKPRRPGWGGKGAPDLAEAADVYIRKGGGDEVFTPPFTWHAYRYCEVIGADHLLEGEDALTYTIAVDVAEAGTFACSRKDFNELHAVCRRTCHANLVGVQSDCPGRERFGYGADLAVSAEAYAMNWDMRDFYLKTLQDFVDEADLAGGWFTETAPCVGIASEGFGGRAGPISWAYGVPATMDVLWRHYGEKRIFKFVPACVRYMRLVDARHPNGIVPKCIGDHVPVERASNAFVATVHYLAFVRDTARFAKLAGMAAEAEEAEKLAAKILAALRTHFIREGKAANGVEAAQILALVHGVISEAERPAAWKILEEDLAAHKGALTTGLLATRVLLQGLSENGRAALAGNVVAHENYPGWLYMLKNGATTIWETWEKTENVYSHNHPMFAGAADEWLYRHVLGISVAQDAVGANIICVRPNAVCGVTWAKGTYRTPQGVVAVSWKLNGAGEIDLDVKAPQGVIIRK